MGISREIISLSVVVCSFIDNISSKHDPELETTASKLNFQMLTTSAKISAIFIEFLLFCFLGTFRYGQLRNFI